MATLRNPVKWLLDWFSGGGSTAVNHYNVTGIPAVFYAINKISNHFSQLPFQPMEKVVVGNSEGARPAKTHRSYRPCRYRANKAMNADVFRKQMICDALLTGNGRAAIVNGGTEYLRLDPYCSDTLLIDGEKYHVTAPRADDQILNAMEVATPEERRRIFTDYIYQNPDGVIILEDRQVLHLIGFSDDGICGVSVIERCREVFSTALESRKHINNEWRKGFTGKIMLEAPPGSFRDEDKAKEFLENFRKAHSTKGDGEIAGLLREGTKANVVRMTARDAQFSEQVADTRRDVALIFMLESILGDDQSVSYNSLAEKNLAFLTNCLHSWLVKWEMECREKLLTDAEKRADQIFYKFNTGALLKTSLRDTMDALAVGVQNRFINRNEARNKLDMNPVEGGEVFENPAIDTVERSESSETIEARALNSLLGHMVSVEVNRVQSAVKAGNFLNQIDKFYSQWSGKLAETVEEVGGDPRLSQEHCEESKQILLNACDGITKDQLPAAIEEVTSGWQDRAKTLANKITEGNYVSC